MTTLPPPVYLDHAATTPLRPAARAAWLAAVEQVGNPSSLHQYGRAARRLVEEAREQVAGALGADPAEVVFTAGGTEADNLAVIGTALGRRAQDPARRRALVSPIEHPAVLESADWLGQLGFEVVEWAVGPDGRVDLERARDLVTADPASWALITCQAVNQETGAIQPLAELAGLALDCAVPLHCDAVQAVGHGAMDLAGTTPRTTLAETSSAETTPSRTTTTGAASGVTTSDGTPPAESSPAGAAPATLGAGLWRPGLAALTLSGHKLGGPVGIGALLARRDLPLRPVLFGGGQERRVRSGTLPTALIAAFAAALTEQMAASAEETARLAGLARRLRRTLTDLGAVLVGPAAPGQQVCHIVNALFPGCEHDALLLSLDAAGLACSTGSACTAGVAQASPVLLALGYDQASARSGLRFSLGWTSRPADIDALAQALPEVLARARRAGRRPGADSAAPDQTGGRP
ncbi:MAG: cysteine desulfurase [Propionibacteriaceae bacterium]|jgi:cysteine desulfurase|nr:cysteine desulfurase [Propionibacteriaceae bacterium]